MIKAVNVSTTNQLFGQAQSLKEQMVDWRRIIHKNHELSFFETETSRLVRDTLERL